jgi:transcriptional regulator with XRE-family HTH domain
MPRDELEPILGRGIRSLRIARSLTQAELARRANVSLGALQHLERGTGATTNTLVRVLRALEMDQWLDTLGPPPAPFNPLDVLAARKADARHATKGPPRVRRTKAATE